VGGDCEGSVGLQSERDLLCQGWFAAGSQPVSKPSFYKFYETAPNAYQQVSKNSARNRPNSNVQFLLASFYFPEPPCTIRSKLIKPRRVRDI